MSSRAGTRNRDIRASPARQETGPPGDAFNLEKASHHPTRRIKALPHQQGNLELPFTDKPGEVTGVEGRVRAVAVGGHTPHGVPVSLRREIFEDLVRVGAGSRGA